MLQDLLLADFARCAGVDLLAIDERSLTMASASDVRQAIDAPKSIAVIPIVGPLAARGFRSLFGNVQGMDAVRQAISSAANNDDIGTIVLDMDSPGGTVDGTQETAAAVRDAAGKKKVIAVANTLAASAMYWIGSQANELAVSPSASVGSIGVLAMHQDHSKALEQHGVKVSVVRAGKFKAELNPFEPLSDEAKAALQSRVDDAHAQFIRDVAQGRKTTQTAVREGFGEGRTVSAHAAVKAGMADRVASLKDVISGLASGSRASAPRTRRSALAFA